MTSFAAVEDLQEIQYLALDELDLSPFNPRKTLDPVKMAELAESIRKQDFLVPLLIRKVPIEGEIVAYHIIAGSRRAAAGKIAGKTEAPCIVREMTDDEARELALVDNLQREEMPALEEADAYEALRQQLGTAETIAARVGKPIEYVAKRLRLVTLGAFSRQALAERLITIDHALLLARLGDEDEAKALKWTLDHSAGIKVKLDKVIEGALLSRRRREKERYGPWEPQSVARLKNHIEQESGRALSKAPWDLDDATLAPEVGACNGCPQNTASNSSLFSDLNIANATCADAVCFEFKRGAFVQIQLLAAGGEKKAARLSWKSSTVRPKMGLLPSAYSPEEKPGDPHYLAHLSRVLREGQWRAAKKGSCPYVISGVTVDWYDGYGEKKRKPGETLTVCVVEKCEAHPKGYEQKAAASGPGNSRDPEAEKARREKNRQLAAEENKLRLAFIGEALKGITTIPAPAIRVIAFEALPGWDEALEVLDTLLPDLVKIIKTAKVDSPELAKAIALASIPQDELMVDCGGYRDESKDGRADLIKTIRGLGYHGPDPWAKPEKAAPPKKAAAKKAVKKAAKKAVKPAKKKAVRK